MPNYTLLIIDYEPRNIRHMTELFLNAGYRVHVARDGVTGIHKFEEVRPDLTLIEAMLPRKHGFDTCFAIKQTEHGKKTPVLIITAVYKGRQYRWEARHKYCCDQYIEKPVEDEALLEAVRAQLFRRRLEAAAPGSAEAKADQRSAPAAGHAPRAGGKPPGAALEQ
jgi:DNA-binding response OmpR family regulator